MAGLSPYLVSFLKYDLFAAGFAAASPDFFSPNGLADFLASCFLSAKGFAGFCEGLFFQAVLLTGLFQRCIGFPTMYWINDKTCSQYTKKGANNNW